MMHYSYKPDKKATPKHLKHFIKKALEHKAFLIDVAKNPKKHCDYNLQTLERDKNKSLKAIARAFLEYGRHRAFMPGAYGGTWPLDKPAHDLWYNLNKKRG